MHQLSLRWMLVAALAVTACSSGSGSPGSVGSGGAAGAAGSGGASAGAPGGSAGASGVTGNPTGGIGGEAGAGGQSGGAAGYLAGGQGGAGGSAESMTCGAEGSCSTPVSDPASCLVVDSDCAAVDALIAGGCSSRWQCKAEGYCRVTSLTCHEAMSGVSTVTCVQRSCLFGPEDPVCRFVACWTG
jgi:hypothetical protein